MKNINTRDYKKSLCYHVFLKKATFFSTHPCWPFALLAHPNTPRYCPWLATLGMIDCLIFLGFCINGLIISGAHSLYLFGGIIAFGIGMFFVTKK